jgi:hypothetical protein
MEVAGCNDQALTYSDDLYVRQASEPVGSLDPVEVFDDHHFGVRCVVEGDILGDEA